MITSIVGRLIKKPEVAERIQIAGKHVVYFTVVENRNRGERRLSVFFNLSVIIGTDAQFDLALRLDKGTVLLFSAPRITYVRQSDRSENEQTINLYADADNFKIVAGAGDGSAAGSSGGGGDMFPAPEPAPAPVSRVVPSGRGAASDRSDRSNSSGWDNGLDEVDDPFGDDEPAPARSGSAAPPRGSSGARSAAAAPPPAARPATGRSQQSAASPPRNEPGASRPAPRRPAAPAPPPPGDEDPDDLSDPFAESDR